MPRKARIISSTGIYHIILRSINQHIIFEEDADYQKFLFILSECKSKHDIDILAYCLMDNHIHLLLQSAPENLASFFQSIGSRFVRWYNNKYLRSGHMFQDRYHSVAIESEESYLSVLKYIHNNPVKAHMCRYPSEYRWSSYNAFYGQNNSCVNTSFSYAIAGSKDSLLQFFSVDEEINEELNNKLSHPPTTHYLTDEQALEKFHELTGLNNTSAVVNLNKITRNEIVRTLNQNGLTAKQIARIMDISITTVRRICKNDTQTPSP